MGLKIKGKGVFMGPRRGRGERNRELVGRKGRESARWITSYLMLRGDSRTKEEMREGLLRVMYEEVGSKE